MAFTPTRPPLGSAHRAPPLAGLAIGLALSLPIWAMIAAAVLTLR